MTSQVSLFPLRLLGFSAIIATSLVAQEPKSTPQAEPESAVLRFLNDNRLVGDVRSFSTDALVLDSPVLAEPAAFPLTGLYELTLPFSSLPLPKSQPSAVVVELTNGDTVRGQLVGVADQAITINTWFAGQMNFNRAMVKEVRVESSDGSSYVGPTGLDDWKQSETTPAWTYRRGAFRSQSAGSIGRADLLGEANRISFDVEWKSDAIGLRVKFFTATATSGNGKTGYELTLQRGSAYLRNRISPGTIGSAHIPEMLENTRVHLEIRSDRKSGKTCLFVNHRIAEVWTDPDVAKCRFGSALQFHALDTRPLKISQIRIAPWDGVIDEIPDPRVGMFNRLDLNDLSGQPPEPTKPAPKSGRMELANGDTLQGEVKSIENGTITITTPLGEVQLPVSRLRSLALKPVSLERCIRRAGDIRAWFPDGSSVVFRLDAATPDSLTGNSQNFGTATFQLKAFERLEFNIYPRLNESRPAQEW